MLLIEKTLLKLLSHNENFNISNNDEILEIYHQ